MKGKRYKEEQIIGILKADEAGAKVADLVREHGISVTAQLTPSKTPFAIWLLSGFPLIRRFP